MIRFLLLILLVLSFGCESPPLGENDTTDDNTTTPAEQYPVLWKQLDGTSGNLITSIAVMLDRTGDTIVFAGTTVNGVLRSTDNGAHWRPVNYGLPSKDIVTIAVTGTTILAMPANVSSTDGSQYGVYQSSDRGANWYVTSLDSVLVLSFGVSGSKVFAGVNEAGIFASTNSGFSWSDIGSDLIDSISGQHPDIVSFAIEGTRILSGTFGAGYFQSTDNGIHWTQHTVDGNMKVFSLAFGESQLFAATETGIYRSTDIGGTWTYTNSGLTAENIGIRCAIVTSGSAVVVGCNAGIFFSGDGGITWELAVVGMKNTQVLSLAVKGSTLYAGTGDGVYIGTMK